MTYRERREARVQRLREWAEKREQKAEAASAAAHALADTIPFGQPILVGHHSEKRARKDRERIWNGIGRAVGHRNMAEHHTQRAENIEQQLDRSIYSDDPDAIEALRERIAGLESQREHQKAANAAYRRIVRGKTPDEQEAALRAAVVAGTITPEDFGHAIGVRSVWRRDSWDTPPYSLTNLTANIARNRDRLAQLEGTPAAPSGQTAQLLAYENSQNSY